MTLAAWTAQDWALLVGAIAAAIATVTGAVASVIGARRAGEVAQEVSHVSDQVATANSQTVGMLADAEETRRIERKPPTSRTDLERDHLVGTPVVPPAPPPQKTEDDDQ